MSSSVSSPLLTRSSISLVFPQYLIPHIQSGQIQRPSATALKVFVSDLEHFNRAASSASQTCLKNSTEPPAL